MKKSHWPEIPKRILSALPELIQNTGYKLFNEMPNSNKKLIIESRACITGQKPTAKVLCEKRFPHRFFFVSVLTDTYKRPMSIFVDTLSKWWWWPLYSAIRILMNISVNGCRFKMKIGSVSRRSDKKSTWTVVYCAEWQQFWSIVDASQK